MLFTEDMLAKADMARAAGEQGIDACMTRLSTMKKDELLCEALELYRCRKLLVKLFDALQEMGVVELETWSFCRMCKKQNGPCLFGGERKGGRVIRCQEYEFRGAAKEELK